MTTQTVLDAPSYKSIDPRDMLGAILGLPEQVDDAKRIATRASFDPLRGKKFSSLVIAGLGGSAIGGDFLRAGYEATLTLPVTVVRDYHLPGYVGENTLVSRRTALAPQPHILCHDKARWRIGDSTNRLACERLSIPVRPRLLVLAPRFLRPR